MTKAKERITSTSRKAAFLLLVIGEGIIISEASADPH